MQKTLQELRVEKDYYTTKQISELYHVSQVTVCGWCRKGWLQAHRQGEGRSKWHIHPQCIEDAEIRKEELIEMSKRYWIRLMAKMR